MQVRYHVGECFHHVSVPDAEDLLQTGAFLPQALTFYSSWDAPLTS